MEAHYGRDLAEELERAGCRKLWVWVNGLPQTAATWRVDGQEWTGLHELLAVMVERIDRWGVLQAYLQSDKKFHKHLPDAPLEVPRPSDKNSEAAKSKEAVTSDRKAIAAFFS